MTTYFLRKQIQLSVGINKFHQAIIIILDQMAVPKRKYSRPKNLVQMSSWVLMRPLYKKKGSASIKNGRKTTTAWVPYYFWIKRGCGGRTTKKLWWTTKNTEEIANPNADLRWGKVKTYGCRSTTEGRRRSLDRLRLMQRPRLRKTRCSAAAAERERQ